MKDVRNEINKVFKQFPNTEKINLVKKNLLDMAEDKYTDLITEGIEEAKASEQVLQSFRSLDEIKDALNDEEIIREYEIYTKRYKRKESFAVASAYLIPFLFTCIGLFISDKSESLALILMIIGLLTIPTCIILAIYFSGQIKKYKKLINTKLDRKDKQENLLYNLISSFVIFIMILLAGLGVSNYIIFSMIPLGFLVYYGIKLLKRKHSLANIEKL